MMSGGRARNCAQLAFPTTGCASIAGGLNVNKPTPTRDVSGGARYPTLTAQLR